MKAIAKLFKRKQQSPSDIRVEMLREQLKQSKMHTSNKQARAFILWVLAMLLVTITAALASFTIIKVMDIKKSQVNMFIVAPPEKKGTTI